MTGIVESEGPWEEDSVTHVVAAHRLRWASSSTEDATFGPVGAAQVAGWYERLCRSVLGSPVQRALFFAASAGCVAGLVLADGRAVVVKAFQPRWDLDFLQVVSAAQRRLAAGGVACPVPETAPLRFEGIVASVDGLLDDPGPRLLQPDEMAASASGLATVARLLRPEEAMPWIGAHPMDRGGDALYPPPHNPIFDFGLDVEAATWIDELARAGLAAQAGDRSAPQLLHGDWSARNVRVRDHEIAAVFDWDSVAALKESTGLGIAAATWRSTGEADDPPAPGPDEIGAYLDGFVRGVGEDRTREWRTAAMGAALFALAYTARCEHARQARDPSVQIRRARHTLDTERRGFLSALGGHP